MAAVATLAAGGYVRKVRLHPPRQTQLIHSVQFLVRRPPVPYVVDFEDIHVFCFYQRAAMRRPWARARLLAALRDERCRYILPWTDAARRGALAVLGDEAASELGGRMVTVLPAVRATTDRPRRRGNGPLRILFVGGSFLFKGGPEAVAAVARLRSTHPVELDLVTFVPENWRRRLPNGGYVRLHSKLRTSQLRELFASAHVLLFPTHVDTLGFVSLEAMAGAMPVIAADHFALPEIVEHEVSGLLFPHENSLYRSDQLFRYSWFLPGHPPRRFLRDLSSPSETYIDGIAAQLAMVAEDAHLYETLSSGALERVRTGPLSPNRRREKLARIYSDALA
jgi:glycosyltransferase involved in cell wall biosynthesis